MGDLLVPVPRFENWNPIKRQDYELAKPFSNTALTHRIDMWQVRLEDPERLDDEQWLAVRMAVSAVLLHETVVIDADIRSGVPILKGTRISIAQVLTEIADGETVDGFADEYDIDADVIKKFLDGLAIHLDRPFIK